VYHTVISGVLLQVPGTTRFLPGGAGKLSQTRRTGRSPGIFCDKSAKNHTKPFKEIKKIY
jgi:hypothetical protein